MGEPQRSGIGRALCASARPQALEWEHLPAGEQTLMWDQCPSPWHAFQPFLDLPADISLCKHSSDDVIRN